MTLCVGSTAGVARAYATSVDGISDQGLPGWDGGFSGSYFASLFDSSWVSSSRIRYARYVVQWNVTATHGAERLDFQAWLSDAASLGLISDVALTSYDGVYPRSTGEYRARLRDIVAWASYIGHPIRYVEAWNEPNNQGNEPAPDAARFANAAAEVCGAGYDCIVIAGDVEDNPGARAYEREYRQHLGFVPSIWGIHPYYSVEHQSDSYYDHALQGLPGGGAGSRIWITEIAARECTDYGGRLRDYGEAGQARRAKWLVTDLIAASKPEHVFYYEFLLSGHKQRACGSEREDDALYLPSGDAEDPDRARLAARYIWEGARTVAVDQGGDAIGWAGPVAILGDVPVGGF